MTAKSYYEKRTNHAVHLVYLDDKAKELEKLIHHEKTMIIRGAAGKKSPLGGRAKVGDDVYFVVKNSSLKVTTKGIISQVVESEKMTPEASIAFIEKYKKELNLSQNQLDRWQGKKYLAVYEIKDIESIEPFYYKRTTNMDDWVIVDHIDELK